MALAKRLLTHIQECELVRPGDSIVIGVSGGPDSMALLHLLYELRHDLGIQLHVAHYNHRWRDSADDDEEFVRRQARNLGLSFSVGRARAKGAKSAKGSAEERAREARIKFFRKIVDKIGAHKVAVAHTKDDLAETVLMRIIRGTGIQGLQAMGACVNLDGVIFLRPLLEIPKDELLTYLEKGKHTFRNDPTNKDLDFFRNRVRHKLLPLLRKDYNPQIDDALINLSHTAAWDYIFMRQQTAHCFSRTCKFDETRGKIDLDIAVFMTESAALRSMVLRKIYQDLTGNTRQLTRAHVRAVEEALKQGSKGPAVTWPGGITIQRGRGRLTFVKPDKP
ncbi:MAG: tRNA lysidine(34) synthetase TilS [Candidatus Omnitrophica bacterium]|nr:tRNA lysidine(34) synthetase TilS [Candidatus Omnitrophota bacterium]MCB9721765.1 tRNA lysidine(34) synthetase TilS [Candidatus Omnitrophota bacterium]